LIASIAWAGVITRRTYPMPLVHGVHGRLGGRQALGAVDRTEHLRRVGHVARLFADAGVVAVASLVSPEAADRRTARELHDAAGLRFVEVYVDTPVEVCEQRDPKGLYAKAREGKITGFTGVDAPYEEPDEPDVRIAGAETEVDDAVEAILSALREKSASD
jgi:bifunctional enzyme CysN/CysC